MCSEPLELRVVTSHLAYRRSPKCRYLLIDGVAMKKFLFACSLVGAALGASAACPSWLTAARFVINGAEVTDQRTGLVWARCSVGQSWSGSACAGSAALLTHETALAHAQSQSGWRLPSVKELASLADKGCRSPAIDSTAFPNTPLSYYWSSSPDLYDGSFAWTVDFSYGYGSVFTVNRNDSRAVRLVRSSR